VEKSGDDIGVEMLRILHDGVSDLMRLTRYVHAAEVRQMCAVAESDLQIDGENETA
jgi:hypothetical protein